VDWAKLNLSCADCINLFFHPKLIKGMQLHYCGTTLQTAKPYNFNYTLRRMKILTFIILVACLQSWATGHTQTINLSLKETRLEKVFQLIRQQSNYRFIYTKEELAGTKPVSVQLQNASIEQAMNTCLAGQPLDWSIDENYITIKKKESDKPVISLLTKLDIRGKITGTNGEALAGATITIKGSNKTVVTNEKGEFTLEGVVPGAILIINSLGHQPIEYTVKDDKNFTVQLKTLVSELENIKLSTGYEELPKERATGSFEKVNNELFNRRVTTNVLERLDGIASGLIFNRKIGTSNPTDISIRGISTINSDQKPLVIVDNFPYEGDINNINPNDIESITILKDAAAASIWGTRAGNGVIVITSKKAAYAQKIKLAANSNITVTNKPDLFFIPQFTAKDFIDLEKFLFDQNYYDDDLTNTFYYPVVSPVVEILDKRRAGLISAADSAKLIEGFMNNDIRKDYSKYLYRKAISQQHAISLTGGTDKINFLFSAGYDKTWANLVGDEQERITLRLQNQIKPAKNLELQIQALVTQNRFQANSLGNSPLFVGGGKGQLYPYAKLADESGRPLAIDRDYRSFFKDTVGNGNMLDWKYSPLDELRFADNTGRSLDVLLNFGTTYTITDSWKIDVKYQHEQTTGETRNYYSPQTYTTRDIINFFTPPGEASGSSAIPAGGILDRSGRKLFSNSLRGQLGYNKIFNSLHRLHAIAGSELRETTIQTNADRVFGFDSKVLSHANVDLTNSYPTYFGDYLIIPSDILFGEQLKRSISYYGNASYTYDRKYTFSLSARNDASNLFGTATNNKWKPLWSAGLCWDITREKFYTSGFMPALKIRTTYGRSGNVNNSIPALLTIQSWPYPNSFTNLPSYLVNNPPNPSLRWENVAMFNAGIDFGSRNNTLTGSVEYYFKKSTDLIGRVPSDITTGYATLVVNSAILKGNGIDVNLHTKNITHRSFKWETNFLFSFNTNKVAKYLFKLAEKDYLSSPITPIEGENAYSIISFRWGGLDPLTGNPKGFLNGQLSEDYRSISQSQKREDFIIHGPTRPQYFGSLRNEFSIQRLKISMNITYQFHYFFRRNNVLNYTSLFNSWSQAGYADYIKRWQKPGDEQSTSVPSMRFPANSRRDFFYSQSSVNVEKGDHIRFRDISVSYSFKKNTGKSSTFEVLDLYFYINNLGILWKANKANLDPDYGTPPSKSFSMGLKIQL